MENETVVHLSENSSQEFFFRISRAKRWFWKCGFWGLTLLYFLSINILKCTTVTDVFGTADPFGSSSFGSKGGGFADFSQMSKVPTESTSTTKQLHHRSIIFHLNCLCYYFYICHVWCRLFPPIHHLKWPVWGLKMKAYCYWLISVVTYERILFLLTEIKQLRPSAKEKCAEQACASLW